MSVVNYLETEYEDEIPLDNDIEISSGVTISATETVLGRGSYGNVYKYVDGNGNEYAVKVMRKENNDYGAFDQAILTDIGILKYLDHPNIVKVLSVHLSEGIVYLVLNRAAYNLRDLIRSKLYNIDHIPLIIYPLVEAMGYYFNMNVLHLDIKPQNILVFLKSGLKFTDFGISKYGYCNVYPSPLSLKVFTLLYKPINILLGDSNYDSMADIWAFGCIIYEMVTGEFLFDGDNEKDMILKIFRKLGTPNEISWPGVSKSKRWWKYESFDYDRIGFNEKEIVSRPKLLDLLNRIFDYKNFCKKYDADHITAILKHPYFEGFNDDISYQYLNCYDKLLLHDRYPKKPSYPYNKIINIKEKLLSICTDYKLETISLFMAYTLIDEFYETYPQGKNLDCELVGIVCLQLSDLINVIYPYDIEGFFIKKTSKIYTLEQFIEVQKIIIETFDWEVYRPTFYDMVKSLSSEEDDEFRVVIKAITINVAFNPDWIFKYKPSKLAKLVMQLGYVYFGRLEDVTININHLLLSRIVSVQGKLLEDSISMMYDDKFFYDQKHLEKQILSHINKEISKEN